MAQINSREIVLLGTTTITTSGTIAGTCVLPQGYTAAILHLNCVTVSGTSPTLNVYIQHAFSTVAATDVIGSAPTGADKYQDLISFTQCTTTGNVAVALVVGGGNIAVMQQDATLTAATVNNGPIGSLWRIKYTVGGTSPSFAITMAAQFIP